MNIDKATRAAQDPSRLEALRSYDLLDTGAEETFDRLTRLASKITNSPISLVSLVDADRQFFKSLVGLPDRVAQARETPLSHSFCKHVVEDHSSLIVEDARQHPILKDNHAVPELNVIAYLGVPLITSMGFCLGSFCIIDTEPRQWSEQEINIVRELALSAMSEIELRAQLEARRQLEEGLRSSEAYARSIVDTIKEGIIVFDDDSRIREWNPQSSLIFGWSREESLGEDFTKLILLPDMRTAHNMLIDHYQKTTDQSLLPRSVEVAALHRDGHEIPVEMTISPIITDDQTLFNTLFRDITEQRAREKALIEARKLAEQATEAKATFLANMSHEIRTPLNSIIGLTSLLLDSELEGVQAKYMKTINRSGRTLLEIINNILDFSKLEAGRMKLEEKPFSLGNIVEETCDLMAADAKEKGLKLDYEFGPGTPHGVIGDATRLQQILINLTNNAIKFTNQGAVSIHVDSSNEIEGRQTFHFQVIDSGIGIPPEHLNRLFRSFSQGDPSTTREYGGTGLGLAISQRLVLKMGGRIWVESLIGEGSVFHFSVQMPVDDSEPRVQQDEVARLGTEMGQLWPLRILIAEDDSVNQMVVLHLLDRLGYQADVVDNGLEVLNALRSKRYDLVLMDVHMPKMDGIEATRAIHSDWPAAHRPYIIAVTAKALPGDKERLLAIGMDEYLSKPLSLEALSPAIRRAAELMTVHEKPEIRTPETSDEQSQQTPMKAIDEAKFLDRLGAGSEPLLLQLVTVFIKEADQGLLDFERALAENDHESAYQSIHKLKGSSSSCAAQVFAEHCREILEMLAQGADFAKIAKSVPILHQALTEVKAWQIEYGSSHIDNLED